MVPRKREVIQCGPGFDGGQLPGARSKPRPSTWQPAAVYDSRSAVGVDVVAKPAPDTARLGLGSGGGGDNVVAFFEGVISLCASAEKS